MSLNRRHVLSSSLALLASPWGGGPLAIAAESPAVDALNNSPLIYLSPTVSGGRESRCHAEVWFIYHQNEIFVVTWAEKWKAEAMRRGFNRAKIWIGDFGPWRSANEAYRSAPNLNVEGRFETESSVHNTLVGKFAQKYDTQWDVWDRRVREGLVNGGWVLLRYKIVS